MGDFNHKRVAVALMLACGVALTQVERVEGQASRDVPDPPGGWKHLWDLDYIDWTCAVGYVRCLIGDMHNETLTYPQIEILKEIPKLREEVEGLQKKFLDAKRRKDEALLNKRHCLDLQLPCNLEEIDKLVKSIEEEEDAIRLKIDAIQVRWNEILVQVGAKVVGNSLREKTCNYGVRWCRETVETLKDAGALIGLYPDREIRMPPEGLLDLEKPFKD